MKRKSEEEEKKDIVRKISRQKHNEAATTLMDLSRDVRLYIMYQLDIFDILTMCKLNQEFRTWCDDPQNVLWQNLIIRDYSEEKYELAKTQLNNNRNDRLLYMAMHNIRDRPSYRVAAAHVFFLPMFLEVPNSDGHGLTITTYRDEDNFDNTRHILSIHFDDFFRDLPLMFTVLAICMKHFSDPNQFLVVHAGDNSRFMYRYNITLLSKNELYVKYIGLIYDLLQAGLKTRAWNEQNNEYITISCSMCSLSAKYQCTKTGKYFCSVECAQ